MAGGQITKPQTETVVTELVTRSRRLAHDFRGPPVPNDQRNMRMEINREIENQIRGGRLSTEQIERLRRAADQMNTKFTQIESGMPQILVRTQNYDITIGTGPAARTFRIMGMTEQLPSDPAAARRILLLMAANHEFFQPSGSVTTPNSPAPTVSVEQISGPGMAGFNGPMMARVDNFEVMLNRARGVSPPPTITVVSISPQQAQRGG